jgi:hypothetical protein
MARITALLTRIVPSTRTSGKAVVDLAEFKHKPLNHFRPSIRLVKISPELSPEGLIQCTISHTTTSRASYTCLSYIWGSPVPCQTILINGKTFQVRQNLYNFLDTVRTKSTPTLSFWIDALSIDQQNISERNHQVAQMGQIFSRAQSVQLWLGKMTPEIFPLLQHIISTKDASYDPIVWKAIEEGIDILSESIFDNVYWTRAWVTQEILLARNITIRLDEQSYDFPSFLEKLRFYETIFSTRHNIFLSSSHFDSTPQSPLGQFVSVMEKPHKIKEKGLVELLIYFQNKQCENPRDRIYSLLSLCSGDGRDVEVKYDDSIADLAYRALVRCEKSLCICAAVEVAHALGMDEPSSQEEQKRLPDDPWLEFDVVAETLGAGGPLRFLYSGNKPYMENGTGFYLGDTCESSSFWSWDESCEPEVRQVAWSTESDDKVPWGQGFELFQHHNDREICTARISLRLLARSKMYSEYFSLCRCSKDPTCRRNPRIKPPRLGRRIDMGSP